MAEHNSAITERIFGVESPGPAAGGAAYEPVRSVTISSASLAPASHTAGATPVSASESVELSMTSSGRLHASHDGSAAQERQQIRVDLILVRCRDAVRRARVVDVLGALDELGGLSGGVVHRHNLIVLAVQHERRDVDLL